MKIAKNKTLEEQMEYARAAYFKFKQTYDYEEAKTREKLESQINELFKQIYAGGMTINIDEKYKITSYVNELEENSSNLDANTAKSYSIIFAFIVGVINLAKQKVLEKTDDASIVTDEYPLVMDAPLSSFDQRRIKNICEVIPSIARQVIIFIKDSLFSFLLGNAIPFVIYLFPSLFRLISLTSNTSCSKCMYQLSNLIPCF